MRLMHDRTEPVGQGAGDRPRELPHLAHHPQPRSRSVIVSRSSRGRSSASGATRSGTTPQNLTPFLARRGPRGSPPRAGARVVAALRRSSSRSRSPCTSSSSRPVRPRPRTRSTSESVERGAVLFANKQSEAYDRTKSLLCADCHGVDASGGAAQFTLSPSPTSASEAEPGQRRHPRVPADAGARGRAPALNTVLLRFDRAQVTQIITYGRPGTPDARLGRREREGRAQRSRASTTSSTTSQSIQISPAKAKARVDHGDRGSSARTAAEGRGRARRPTPPTVTRRRSPTPRPSSPRSRGQGRQRRHDHQRRERDAEGRPDRRRRSEPVGARVGPVLEPAGRADEPGRDALPRSTAPAATRRTGRSSTRRSRTSPSPRPSGSGAYGPSLDRVSLAGAAVPGQGRPAEPVQLGGRRRPGQQPLRRPGHLHRPHAALRQDADHESQINEIIDYERNL